MSRLNYITSGESHGKCLAAILEGMPSGLSVSLEVINHELARRQSGYGRGNRQMIEKDRVEITSGLLRGKTTGAPIHLVIYNRDFKIDSMPELLRPRPGHADLAGSIKYDEGIRAILERSSARETAIRVAVGSLTRQLLSGLDVEVLSHVVQIGKVKAKESLLNFDQILKLKKNSALNTADSSAEKKMILEIKRASNARDTVGGAFELRAKGLPIGLGSHAHYASKLDGRIAQALMSIQSVKAVGFGLGTEVASLWGSKVHDEIFYSWSKGFFHRTNRAGGVEGGMTNGEELVARVYMKPISTLGKPLRSINLKTRAVQKADFERSDICAVTAGSVVGEAILAFEIADALLEKTGGDSLSEVKRNLAGVRKHARAFKL